MIVKHDTQNNEYVRQHAEGYIFKSQSGIIVNNIQSDSDDDKSLQNQSDLLKDVMRNNINVIQEEKLQILKDHEAYKVER